MANPLVSLIWMACLLTMAAEPPATDHLDEGSFVRAFWLIQRFGTPDAVDPRNDERVKGTLVKALGRDGVLTPNELDGLMDPSTFSRLAGPDNTLGDAEIQKILDDNAPPSRTRLLPEVASHVALLSTSLDMIDEPHQAAGRRLANWIASQYQPGRPLHITVICTGNSRRSILGATMGNIAAAYYGMPEIRFHSGGTSPSAFNSRSIAALRAIGVEVEPTGNEAPRGEPDTPNPTYRVRWGKPGASEELPLETVEFSKMYLDPSNPQRDFAALLVCGEADASCPVVKGAALRLSMPYLDPKIYDGSSFEAAKYAERRDDIGRLMLSVMLQVRNRLSAR